jgi:hypothetical protein
MIILFRRHKGLALAFLSTATLTLGLLVWVLIDVLNWDGARREPVAGWMTVGYVARAWNLDPVAIDGLAGLPLPVDGVPFTINQIATDRGVPVADVIKQVEDAVATLVAQRELDHLTGPDD